MKKKGLESLHVWQKARELVIRVYQDVLPNLPIEEKYVMSQQIRRSAQSVPANIAEAYGRYSYQEAIRFSYIARGSLEETYNHLILARDLGYVPNENILNCLDLYREVARLLNGYIEYHRRSKEKGVRKKLSEPGGSLEYESYSMDFDPLIPDS